MVRSMSPAGTLPASNAAHKAARSSESFAASSVNGRTAAGAVAFGFGVARSTSGAPPCNDA